MPETNEIAEEAKSVLEELLTRMGVTALVEPHATPFVEVSEGEVAPITFDMKGDDLGILIGRHGQTITSLQYILRLIISHQTKTWVPIFIDVEGYKSRRYQALRALALRMAEQVKTKRMPFSLEPMPAFERRIIHLALAEHPDVITQSVGEGETRKVVILPKNNSLPAMR